MSPRRGSPPTAIVVGAGVAGLTAGCTLARAGVQTTLLEACGEPGGLCRTIRRGTLSWSLALYSLRGGAPGGPLASLLEELAIAGRVPLRHTKRAYRVLLGDRELRLGSDDAETLAAAAGLGSGAAAGLQRLLGRIRSFDPVRDHAALRGATFAEAIADLGLPPPLRALLGGPLMVSLGLPPERASAYFAFMKYRLILEEGLSWPEGGADALVNALVAQFLEVGGDLRLGEGVVAVTVEAAGRKVVTCESMERHTADLLVLACDATTALDWLAPHLGQRFAGKARRLTPTLPAALVLFEGPPAALGRTGLDDFAHLVVLADDDLAGAYAQLRRGDAAATGLVAGLTSPGTWQASAPAERVPLTGFFLVPEGTRQASAEELGARLARQLGRAGVDLKPVVAVGPEVLRTMAHNRGGAFCGWEMGPERYGPDRIPQALRVPGVWLAGHWTDPGPSVLNAMLSGRTAARRLLEQLQRG